MPSRAAGERRLRARGDLDRAVGGAGGDRPRGRAVDQQAVAQRHPAEAQALGLGRAAVGAAPLAAGQVGSLIRAPAGRGRRRSRPRARCRRPRRARRRRGSAARPRTGHLALRAEAVDGRRVERLAEPVAVGEAGHHDRHQSRRRGRARPARPRSRRRAATRAGERLPSTRSANSTSTRRRAGRARSASRSRTSGSPAAGRHPAVDQHLGRATGSRCPSRRRAPWSAPSSPAASARRGRRRSRGDEPAQPLDRGLEPSGVGAAESSPSSAVEERDPLRRRLERRLLAQRVERRARA